MAKRVFDSLEKGHAHLELNTHLRRGERAPRHLQKLYDLTVHSLARAVPSSSDTIVWRGLAGTHLDWTNWSPGTRLTQLGFIWCSSDQWVACRFTHDTSSFYATRRTTALWKDVKYESVHEDGVLLRVRVPAGTRFLETPVTITALRGIVTRQLLLCVDLRVEEVDKKEQIVTVTVEKSDIEHFVY